MTKDERIIETLKELQRLTRSGCDGHMREWSWVLLYHDTPELDANLQTIVNGIRMARANGIKHLDLKWWKTNFPWIWKFPDKKYRSSALYDKHKNEVNNA